MIRKLILLSCILFSVSLASVDAQRDSLDFFDFWKSTVLTEFGETIFKETDDYLIKKSGDTYWFYFVRGSQYKATEFVTTFKDLLGITSDFAFQELKKEKDRDNNLHFRQQIFYKGIEIEGGQLLMHEKDGILAFASIYLPDNLPENVTPLISEEKAIELAIEAVGAEKYMWESEENEEFIKSISNNQQATYYPIPGLKLQKANKSEVTKLVYIFSLQSEKPFNTSEFTLDALNGDLISKIPLQCTSSHTQNNVCNSSLPLNSNIRNMPCESLCDFADTEYNGCVQLILEQNGAEYRLKSSDSKIHVKDLQNGENPTNAIEIIDGDNVWEKELIFRRLLIEDVSDNWMDHNFETNLGLYFSLTDNSGNIIYTSEIDNNIILTGWGNLNVQFENNLILNNPPYSLKVWDDDNNGEDDLLLTSTLR